MPTAPPVTPVTLAPTGRRLRAGVHARRSLNRLVGQSASVRRQIADATALADRIGADVAVVYDEDDTSAFAKRVVELPDGRRVKRNVRPQWQQALRDLYDGTIDVLIEYDLDRAMREPRDLEDLIEVIEATGRQVESVTGSLRLRTDHEITMARVMVAMANKSSRDTARRVASAARARAVDGKPHGGQRCFGYEPGGMAVDAVEAVEVRRAAQQILSGVPLGAVTRDLNARGVRTVTGRQWHPNALRDTLRWPRLAGLSMYRGEVVGRGAWPAILDVEVHHALVALFADPARRTSTGNRAATLLTGLATCQKCGNVMVAGGTKTYRRRDGSVSQRQMYRCRPAGCSHHRRDWADDWVRRNILKRLARPDAADLLVDRARPDGALLEQRAASLQVQLDDAAGSYARQAITIRQLEQITADLRAKLDEVRGLQTRTDRAPMLRDLVQADDPAAVWEAMSLDRQRSVVAVLVNVVFVPGGRGVKHFLPERVLVTPKV